MAFNFGDPQTSSEMDTLVNIVAPSLICFALVMLRGPADIKLGRSAVIDGALYQLTAFLLLLGLFIYATWNGFPFWNMIGSVTVAFLIAWVLTKGIERLPDRFPESALYTLLLLAGIGFGMAFLVKFSTVVDALRWNSAMPAVIQKVH